MKQTNECLQENNILKYPKSDYKESNNDLLSFFENMQVKKIYMDLKEAKPGVNQWRDVRVLESETFKDPITIDIAYDDKDREFIEVSKKVVEDQVKEAWRILQKIEDKIWWRNEVIEEYREKLKEKDKKIEDLTKRLEKSGKEKVQLLQEAKNDRDAIDKLNEQLEAVKELLHNVALKITKEPRVFNGQSFISWNWISALTALTVPNGNYIVSEVLKIVEKNEYVENEDMEVHAYNLHVTDGLFVPEYDLIGTTKLDTPTATIDRTFTLLPY